MGSGSDFSFRKTEEGNSVVTPANETKELTEVELVTQAFMQYETTLVALKQMSSLWDRNKLNRVLNAIISFPLSEKDLKLIHNKKDEVQFVTMALGMRTPIGVINTYLAKTQGDLQEEAANNLADKVIEANPEFKKPKQEGA